MATFSWMGHEISIDRLGATEDLKARRMAEVIATRVVEAEGRIRVGELVEDEDLLEMQLTISTLLKSVDNMKASYTPAEINDLLTAEETVLLWQEIVKANKPTEEEKKQ